MASMKDIRQFADAIVREFAPEQIILFGSHARGEAGRDSDVDLLVVMRHRGHWLDQAVTIRRQIARPFPLDLLVRSPNEIRKRLAIHDSFVRDILEEGKVLHGSRDRGVGRKSRGRLEKRTSRTPRAKVAKP